MARPAHPNKHIEAAISYAEINGWEVSKSNGHAWGHLLCAYHDRAGCRLSVWSTPRNAESHAKALKRAIDRCPHIEEADNEDI